jgi:hypothetical protein
MKYIIHNTIKYLKKIFLKKTKAFYKLKSSSIELES